MLWSYSTSLNVLCFIFVRLAFHTLEILNVSFAKFETSDYSVSSSTFIKCTARLMLASFQKAHVLSFSHPCTSLTLCSVPKFHALDITFNVIFILYTIKILCMCFLLYFHSSIRGLSMLWNLQIVRLISHLLFQQL